MNFIKVQMKIAFLRDFSSSRFRIQYIYKQL
jgi:hypothetical protein